jgi:hypothetical protein
MGSVGNFHGGSEYPANSQFESYQSHDELEISTC